MFKKLADGRMMVAVENDNQNMELKKICKSKDVPVCKVTGKNVQFPIFFCFVEIIKTGKVFLVPERDRKTLNKNGWEAVSFKDFKRMIEDEE